MHNFQPKSCYCILWLIRQRQQRRGRMKRQKNNFVPPCYVLFSMNFIREYVKNLTHTRVSVSCRSLLSLSLPPSFTITTLYRYGLIVFAHWGGRGALYIRSMWFCGCRARPLSHELDGDSFAHVGVDPGQRHLHLQRAELQLAHLARGREARVQLAWGEIEEVKRNTLKVSVVNMRDEPYRKVIMLN